MPAYTGYQLKGLERKRRWRKKSEAAKLFAVVKAVGKEWEWPSLVALRLQIPESTALKFLRAAAIANLIEASPHMREEKIGATKRSFRKKR